MATHARVTRFLKDCYIGYLEDLQSRVPAFPRPYLFPDGNPIQPVLPVHTATGAVMIIGAFPSARFERRNGKLIPVGNNLSPFGEELYFDGRRHRVQESAERLWAGYLQPLRIDREQIWLTDIVKVYLYPDDHIRNCWALFPSTVFVNTHSMFPELARASLDWMKREISVCNPNLVITLGEVAARCLSGDWKTPSRRLLDGEIRPLAFAPPADVVHLAHPEIRRRNRDWDERTGQQTRSLARKIRRHI